MQRQGKKNAVAGDAKYDSPGRFLYSSLDAHLFCISRLLRHILHLHSTIFVEQENRQFVGGS